ncbi:uncharacterized protein BCR38DRAFT_177882 [Pseudomassariella vexata]|uniref:Uncharacterized protein n=1 Tax=Pseudomassariella vexata TaxID=1141098 RepID=A0A1Y2E4A6_9PEZI|nr:uncharacterized protein BCR38DRAFT_177882 [Pseudomassariella vexata]ORY66349.1 hypothetical protein BCR38DRAFT_177882 [Pseudomassariella vexata]
MAPALRMTRYTKKKQTIFFFFLVFWSGFKSNLSLENPPYPLLDFSSLLLALVLNLKDEVTEWTSNVNKHDIQIIMLHTGLIAISTGMALKHDASEYHLARTKYRCLSKVLDV